MEIICVDDKFPKDALDFYAEFGVVTPNEGSLYSIRDVIINSNGKTGLLLEELVNPKVPITHPLIGPSLMEPSWDIIRFRNLDNTEIDVIELKQSIKLPVKIEICQKERNNSNWAHSKKGG